MMYFLRSNRFKAPWLGAHDSLICPVSFFIVQVVIIIYIVFMIWYMLKIIKDSMFQKKGKKDLEIYGKKGLCRCFWNGDNPLSYSFHPGYGTGNFVFMANILHYGCGPLVDCSCFAKKNKFMIR